MDQLYALGVTCIEYIQYLLEDYEAYFEVVNDLSNPHNILDYLFPMVAIVDSVFAAQLLLCIAFGGWLNAVMKWWFLEERPYWWVRETKFYRNNSRPVLRQFRQTCETGPGCPSGHSATVATVLMLIFMWIAHVVNDRKWSLGWWKYMVYPLYTVVLGSVMFARMFIATHFPHQVLFGGLVGSFLAPALCIYVTDPFIWRYGFYKDFSEQKTVFWHVFSAIVTIAIAGVTYLSLVLCGWDPMWTVKLAFKWCEQPENIHVSTTPMFALVQCTASLLGWALCVTPAVSKYRHYSKNRSLIIAAAATTLIVYVTSQLEANIPRSNAWRFYALSFLLYTIKPILLLRLTPALAMLPYPDVVVTKVKKS